MYLEFACGEISRFRRLRNSRRVLWFCGVTMPTVSAGGQQGVLGVASALCCTRESRTRHFAAAEKNSRCYSAFRRVEYFTLSDILYSLWRLRTVTANYFWVFLLPRKSEGADWQEGLEVSFLTALQVCDLLVWRARMQLHRPLRMVWNSFSSSSQGGLAQSWAVCFSQRFLHLPLFSPTWLHGSSTFQNPSVIQFYLKTFSECLLCTSPCARSWGSERRRKAALMEHICHLGHVSCSCFEHSWLTGISKHKNSNPK